MNSTKSMRILLTNLTLVNFAGSEINCLQLAKYLIKQGHIVEVATFDKKDPINKEFYLNNICVKNVLFEELNYCNYDLIWAHHTILLDYLLFKKGISSQKIIYSCLSSFDKREFIPLYINKLDLCLANSYETRDTLLNEGVKKEKIYIFPNYITEEFLNYNRPKQYSSLKKIAIVSNHVPEELLEVKKLFDVNNIIVDIYGIGYIEKLITPNILQQYDLIISIGKTVQYAIGLKVPVFCYDIHGGPGFLTPYNIDKAFEKNFSGRGFPKKTGVDIFNEILLEYQEKIKYINNNFEFVIEKCDLSTNIKKLFKNIKNMKEKKYEDFLVGEYSKYNRLSSFLLEQLRQEINYKNEFESIIRRETEMKKNKEILEDTLQDIQLKYENLELAFKNINRELVEKNNRIDQQEKNVAYLLEVIAEKDREIECLMSSKTFKALKVYKDIKLSLYNIKEKIIYKIKKDRFYKESNHLIQTSNDNIYNPKVTVVIPIYDREDVLIQSIESILNQSYQDFELLLVCDGSPQKTLDIVKSYEENPKVRTFYFKDNSGNAVRGRNKAILEARGEYLAFQDSDDIADKDRLKNSIEFIEKYKADIVYGGWRALVDGSRAIDIKNNQEVYSPDCDYEMLKKICVPCQSTVMVRLQALRDVGGLKTSMRYREDHELWLRLAYFGYKFKAIDKILTNLRLHANNLELSFLDTDDKWFNMMLEEHTKKIKIKPKIAYLIPGCGISGGIAVICQHVNRLQKRGYDVLLITEDNNTSIEWFPNQNVNIVNITEAPDNIDILVATGWSTAYTAQTINAKRKIYFVQSDESRFYPEDTIEYKKALESYEFDFEYMTEALWIQKWLKEKFSQDAYYVPNGLDEKIVYKTEPLVPKTDKIRILLEGPIDIPFKGMEDAFNAVNGLDCEVWCISSAGKPKPEWKCDKFFEKVPMEQMKVIYSSCDIFLKMSRVEGFFGPPLEMMACEGACVVSKVTGYDEYIIDGYNALVVEMGDVQAAHNALKKLINDKILRENIIQNGIETSKKWRWEPTIDILEDIFYRN